MDHNANTASAPVVLAEKECDVYCPICRKLLHLEKGQPIPKCCGKPMRVFD
jgi:hypothetical protein